MWHTPNGETHNQVDFILAPRRFKPSIKARTRTFPGALGDPQTQAEEKSQHSPRIRFNIWKLKDPQYRHPKDYDNHHSAKGFGKPKNGEKNELNP